MHRSVWFPERNTSREVSETSREMERTGFLEWMFVKWWMVCVLKANSIFVVVVVVVVVVRKLVEKSWMMN